jgi:ATP-dependent Clp protease ATP-binding subunit ClpA
LIDDSQGGGSGPCNQSGGTREWQPKLKAVMKEVIDSDGGIILFIDEIHTVVGAGGSGSGGGGMDAGNLLKPMLGRGELRCIGRVGTIHHVIIVRQNTFS